MRGGGGAGGVWTTRLLPGQARGEGGEPHPGIGSVRESSVPRSFCTFSLTKVPFKGERG